MNDRCYKIYQVKLMEKSLIINQLKSGVLMC